MKILVLTPSYPTEEDPVNGVFVREQAVAVAELADVSVLHLARGHPWGVRPVHGEPVPTWRSGFPRRPAGLGLVAAAGIALRKLPRPDVIHAHFFLGAAPAIFVGGSPVVTTEHWVVFLPEAQMPLSLPRRVVARYALNRSRVVVAVSETLSSALRDAGVKSPIVVIPNAVDDGVFHPPATPPSKPGRLLTVGILTAQKGVDTLLEALALLPRDMVELEVVGDGPARAELETLAQSLDLSEAVEFAGFLPKVAVAERMRSAGLFVLASRFETNGVVVLEALASGLPVVASDIGPFRELVDDSNGVLAAPEDPAALAAAIRSALDSPGRFDRAGIATAARRLYGRETVGRALIALYEEVLR